MTTTTLRSDMVEGLHTMLQTFAAANPTYLKGVYRSRPASFGDRPLAFVGPRNESISNESLLFLRSPELTAVFLWSPSANQRELAEVRDDIIDAFIGYARDRPHMIGNTVSSGPSGVQDIEIDLDGSFYPATVVSFVVWHQQGSQ